MDRRINARLIVTLGVTKGAEIVDVQVGLYPQWADFAKPPCGGLEPRGMLIIRVEVRVSQGTTAMRLFEGTPFDRPPRGERCGELEAVRRNRRG
ncbi:MAG: hypothetical protein ACREX9_01025 [Gammaproteobacteria bacterium]